MKGQIKRVLAILFAVLFVATVTASAVSADDVATVTAPAVSANRVATVTASTFSADDFCGTPWGKPPRPPRLNRVLMTI